MFKKLCLASNSHKWVACCSVRWMELCCSVTYTELYKRRRIVHSDHSITHVSRHWRDLSNFSISGVTWGKSQRILGNTCTYTGARVFIQSTELHQRKSKFTQNVSIFKNPTLNPIHICVDGRLWSRHSCKKFIKDLLSERDSIRCTTTAVTFENVYNTPMIAYILV